MNYGSSIGFLGVDDVLRFILSGRAFQFLSTVNYQTI